MRAYQVEVYWTVRGAWMPLGPACSDAVQALRLFASIPIPDTRKRVRVEDTEGSDESGSSPSTEFDFRRVEFVHHLLATGRLSEGTELSMLSMERQHGA